MAHIFGCNFGAHCHMLGHAFATPPLCLSHAPLSKDAQKCLKLTINTSETKCAKRPYILMHFTTGAHNSNLLHWLFFHTQYPQRQIHSSKSTAAISPLWISLWKCYGLSAHKARRKICSLSVPCGSTLRPTLPILPNQFHPSNLGQDDFWGKELCGLVSSQNFSFWLKTVLIFFLLRMNSV